jgi:hypothetical protein
MSETEIMLGRTAPTPSTSLAQMLKSQYTSREFHDIMGATEVREAEIVGCAAVFATRFVSLVKSTAEWQLKGLPEGSEERKNIEERLAVKQLIDTDPCAMTYVLQDSYLYAFGLLRQSLKRQSRSEAVTIATSPKQAEVAENVGLKDKLFSKLGISRKYRTVYEEK